jgi:hypothetical protein
MNRGAMRLCARDQTRRTSGVVVGGAVPGGELCVKNVCRSRRTTGSTETALIINGDDFAVASARSAAVVVACRMAPSCVPQSCSGYPLTSGPLAGGTGSSHFCPEPWCGADALDVESHTVAHTVPDTGKPARMVRRTTAIRWRHCMDRVYRGWQAWPDCKHHDLDALGRPR